MPRTGRPIKNLEEKTKVLTDNGFPTKDVFPWWRKFHGFCNIKKLRPNVDNHLTFADYMQKAREAGLQSPDQIGVKRDQFQMGRLGDMGHYTPDNCRFITKLQNVREAFDNGRFDGARAKAMETNRVRLTGTTRETSMQLEKAAQASMKGFRVISPDGVTYVSTNVSEFARDHGFNLGGLAGSLSGRLPHYKGWVGEYVDGTPDELIGIMGLGFPSPAIIGSADD